MKRTYCPPQKRKNNHPNNSMHFVKNVGIKHQHERAAKQENKKFYNKVLFASATNSSDAYAYYDY